MNASLPRRALIAATPVALFLGAFGCGRAPVGGAVDDPPDELGLPRTDLARAALALVTEAQEPAVGNHSLRSYLFAKMAAGPRSDYDTELVFLICALHDMGLTDRANTGQRFEVDGADFAARFLEDNGVTDGRVDTVWDAIALHVTPGIHSSPVFARRRPEEIRIAQRGIDIDVGGGPADVSPEFAERVHSRYPRLGGARLLMDRIEAQALADPRKAPPMTLAGELLRQRHPELPYPTWDQLLAAGGWGDS